MANIIDVDPAVARPPESPASKSETPTAASTPANDDTEMAMDNENGKSSKTPTPSKGGKRKSISIPYTQVIHDAIVALKDRTGSSSPAIQKWIMNNHPSMDPTKLKQKMNFTLKLGVKSKRFIKIKSSFKINPVWIKTDKKKKAAANAKKRKATAAANAKGLAAAVAAKKAAAAKKPLTKAEIAAQKEKERKERAEKERQKKEKERQDRIRKRKFPMDDLKLIEEDRELRVVCPYKDNPRPALELAMPSVPTVCRSDTMGSGVMNDIVHIYHFFRGDVGWGRFRKQKSLVAPFSLEQWMECVLQVSKGWCKKARMLPPLMTHLFVVTLQHLVPEKLSLALTPASWSEVLLLYMDAMEQKYREKIKAEEGKNTIRSMGIDTEYLFYVTDEPKDASSLDAPTSDSSYLGTGILKKAHSKCVNTDPWQLNAEELLSLLRALVDDVLGTSGDCAEELEIRNDETYELLKRKKASDAQFRKIQTARNRQLAAQLAAEKEKQKAEEAASGSADKEGANGEEKKPEKITRSSSSNGKLVTISEQKLEKVRREQQKAQDAYDKSCRSKRIRTEPVGMDRNFQEVYHSLHDPELIFFLQRGKPIQSDLSFEVPDGKSHRRVTWQAIKKKSVLNKYMESLDVRGIRESNLHEALAQARRHVYDDIKEMNDKKALLREKSDVKRRLENAQKSYQNGRKSGRLASQSEQELIDLQEEIERLEKSVADGNVVEEYDMELETGLDMLRDFDTQEQQNQRRRANRREVQQNLEDEGKGVKKLHCSRLWPSGHIDGTGIVGLTVSQLLDLEERVEKLAKWETGNRKSWISSVETAIHAWNEGSMPYLIYEDISSAAKKGSSLSSLTSPEPKDKKNISTPGSAASNGTSSSNSIMSSYQIVCMIRVSFIVQ
jgi:histone H1/5